MKTLILLLSLALCGAAQAQTNVVKTPRAPTEISSDAAEFDMNTTARTAIYHGHVVVIDPQMKLQCERLVVFLPENGERLNHIEAQTNVVIDFSDNHGSTARAKGSLAVYHYGVQNSATNETVTLTGNPQVESQQGILTGDQIIWDRANNRLRATEQHMIFKQSLNDNLGTNSAPIKLF